MGDLDHLRGLIADGSDDKAATRALSILLGAEYEMQPISNQSGEYRQVQIKPPSCGYVALDNCHIAFRALGGLGVDYSVQKCADAAVVQVPGFDGVMHTSLARAVWLAVVDVIQSQQGD